MTLSFANHPRFELVRQIGAGGMGVVYEVFDRERSARVALKTISHLDALALYRLKKEFRSLADLAHPNLVQLHELEADGDECFFTMELIEGVDILRHVRARSSSSAKWRSTPDALASTARDATNVGPGSDPPPTTKAPSTGQPKTPRTADLVLLRAALPQLALGLHALHAAGKVHRDVKPPNVLVETTSASEPRVVLLDFGIVADLREQGATDVDLVIGTPQYMAPEQAAALPLTAAADWYSVGTILYEALTGRLPFLGPSLKIMMDKQRFEPPRPRELVPSVPEDLDELCVALMRRDPTMRPNGAEVLRRLGVDLEEPTDKRSLVPPPTWQTAVTPFVGRESQLAELRAAFDSMRSGRAELVFVRGESGMGKSTFVRRFLEDVTTTAGALVFQGRCFERESVPYKAFDAIVDGLSRHLRVQSRSDGAGLLPTDPGVLPRLFPVLGRVPALANAERPGEFIDPQQLRRRAFAALRETFALVADRKPTVLFIDDMQWGDVDSTALLAELVAPPDAPPLLLIVGYRLEDEARSDVLRAILQPRGGAARERSTRVVTLDAFSNEDAERCAALLLGSPHHPLVRGVARESGGNPLFLAEIVRFVETNTTGDATVPPLATIFQSRMLELPSDALRLLEVIAVAARPIRQDIAEDAAGIEGPSKNTAMRTLRAGNFVRSASTTSSSARSVECFHDRIRETAVALLDDGALRARHAALVDALRAGGETDPDAMFVHARAAGIHERAAEYADAAARNATNALAFDRAAALLRAAIELSKPEAKVALDRRVRLGDALANAGRGADAAAQYLEAAESADRVLALELRRRAAERLLQVGDLETGLDVLRGVLAQVGMRLSATPLSALVKLVFLRLWLRIRGLGFVERQPAQLSAEELTRIDLCWSVAASLAAVDNIQASEFQTRHLLLALRAGEPFRLTRAIATEGAFAALLGVRNRAPAMRLMESARAILPRTDHVAARGYVAVQSGVIDFYLGEWATGRAHFEDAAAIFSARDLGLAWERQFAQSFALRSLYFLGDFREMGRRAPTLLRDVDGGGDRYFQTSFRLGEPICIWLTQDRPAEALREVDATIATWPRDRFLVQHWWADLSRALIGLYEGDGRGALTATRALAVGIRRSLLVRLELVRLLALSFAGGAALLAARDGNDRAQLRAAARNGRAILRAGAPWADPLGHLLVAGVAHQRGERARAIAALEKALAGFVAAEMALYAAATRRRLGALMGGDDGRARVDDGTAFMRAHGVKNVGKMTRMLAPGFDDDASEA